ncbi:alcohol dehydrogenase catalytic domain-containing protein, partial [Nonomuraea fuscirosea]
MSTPETMHAVRITRHGGLEALEHAEVAIPVPAEGDVLVRVMAVALNNTDLWTREGSYGRPGDPDALSGWRGPIGFPRIQGADVAGRVTAAGARKDEALIGRRVVVDPAIYDAGGPDANPVGLMGSERDGGYAEYVLAPVERVHDVTGSPLTDDQLAALPTAYGTALGMIERGRLEAGQTVLVSGSFSRESALQESQPREQMSSVSLLVQIFQDGYVRTSSLGRHVSFATKPKRGRLALMAVRPRRWGGMWDALPDAARSIVKELIIHGPQSRTALAKTLHLSTGSLTRLTKPMVDAGLLVEGEVVHDPVNGRPTRPLDVAAAEHRFLGIKLTSDRVHAVVTDLRAEVIAARDEPIA